MNGCATCDRRPGYNLRMRQEEVKSIRAASINVQDDNKNDLYCSSCKKSRDTGCFRKHRKTCTRCLLSRKKHRNLPKPEVEQGLHGAISDSRRQRCSTCKSFKCRKTQFSPGRKTCRPCLHRKRVAKTLAGGQWLSISKELEATSTFMTDTADIFFI